MFQVPKGASARDAVSSIIILIVCAVGILQTMEYPDRAAQWPLWMWGLLALCSVVLLFNSVRRPVTAEEAAADAVPAVPSPGRALRIAINIALIIILIVLVPVLGFYTATGLYLCISMYYLGIRPVWKIATVAGSTLIVFYGMFEYFLGVLIPHGLIF